MADLLRPALASASAEGAVRKLQQSVLDFIGDNSRDDIALLLLLRNANYEVATPLAAQLHATDK